MPTGLPQASTLDPILFIIYTVALHYLLEAIGVSFQLYAGDTQVYVTMNDYSETKEKLTQVHDAVCCWMHNRKQSLYPGKTVFLLIKPTRNDQLILPDTLLFGESFFEVSQ